MSDTNIIVLYLIRNYILFINECDGKTGFKDTEIWKEGGYIRKVPYKVPNIDDNYKRRVNLGGK